MSFDYHILPYISSQCFGPSMQPTIDGDFVLVNNFIYMILRRKPSKGDVVLCHPPNSIKIVCKRIQAIQGESVEYLKDGMIVNEVIPAGHVWLLGDNLEMSVDSRAYGPVQTSNIRGKVLYKLKTLEPVK